MPRLRTAPFALAVVASALLAVSPGAFAATHAKKRHAAKPAAARSFSGTVSSVAPKRKTLALKTSRGATVRLAVTRATKGVRLRGLKRGQAVTVRAKRTRGGWTAARITRVTAPATDDATEDTGDDLDETPSDLEDESTDEPDTPVDGDITQDGFSGDDSLDPLGA